MAPRKRQRNNEACSALAPPPPTLPADLLLEIVARSDATTLIRCAAACRLLRCRILTAAFIQHVFAGVVPQCVLARLHTRRPKRPHRRRKPLVSLVYPSTPAASSLVGKHLAPFVSRQAADLLWQYAPVTSRRGLIVLRLRRRLRWYPNWCERSSSDLCVYDPMTNARTFLSEPPTISMDSSKGFVSSSILLTAADGIGCRPFLLLVARMCKHPNSTLRVQTSSPSDAGDISWGPVTESESVCHTGSFEENRGVVVLPGGVIHWLTRDHKILTYDIRTGKSGTVKHPHMPDEHHLAMSPDGRLRILAVQGFMISVWEQLSAGGWSPCATIDTEEKLRSMHPDILFHGAELLELRSEEEIRSNAVLLKIHGRVLLQVHDRVVVLDLETKEMGKQEDSSSSCLFEVDLLARLQAMRIF